MSVERRALLIGMVGPALQAVGLVWQTVHVIVHHWHEPLSARHLMYEPGVLLIVVGFLLSLVCIPAALEVVRARQSEVEIPLYEPEPAVVPQATEAGSYSSSQSGSLG